jgi:hypothetical protein
MYVQMDCTMELLNYDIVYVAVALVYVQVLQRKCAP